MDDSTLLKKERKCSLLQNLKMEYGTGRVEDYKYMGGARYYTKNDKESEKKGYNHHYKYLLQLIAENGNLKRSMNFEMIDNDTGDEWFNCICGMDIKQRCFIIKKSHELVFDNFITIGNCCIKLFGIKKQCECGNEHRNTKDNLCNDCREKEKEKDKRRCELCNIVIRKNLISDYCKTCEHNLGDIYEFEDFKHKMVYYGKYKNQPLRKLLKDKHYFNYIKESHLSNCYLTPENVDLICNSKDLGSYLYYIEQLLYKLKTIYKDKYNSCDYMDYI